MRAGNLNFVRLPALVHEAFVLSWRLHVEPSVVIGCTPLRKLCIVNPSLLVDSVGLCVIAVIVIVCRRRQHTAVSGDCGFHDTRASRKKTQCNAFSREVLRFSAYFTYGPTRYSRSVYLCL